MPPCASGPVFTVSRPSRNGSDCAMAGVGKRLSAAAAPAAVPANTARRLTLRELTFDDVSLRDIAFLPVAPRLLRPIVVTAPESAAFAATPPSATADSTLSLAKRLDL